MHLGLPCEFSRARFPSCLLRCQVYLRRMRKYLGAYLVHLGGHVDAIVFSAGRALMRARARNACKPLAHARCFTSCPQQRSDHDVRSGPAFCNAVPPILAQASERTAPCCVSWRCLAWSGQASLWTGQSTMPLCGAELGRCRLRARE